MDPAPFELVQPRAPETPVVVEVPHAGMSVAPRFLAPMVAPLRALGRDADVYVDALYADAPDEGATLLVARASRFVIDLNRAESDVDGDVVENAPKSVRFNHGLIWRVTSEGERVLARPLVKSELQERLDAVWRPYHRVLAEALEQKRRRFGVAVLVAGHSMPGIGRGKSGEPQPRADVVPGTRGRTSAAGRFIDLVEAHARTRGWTVRHDDPYAGGYTTQTYGRPDSGVHAVQVELARRLYVDEATLRPIPGMQEVRAWCRTLVRELGQAAIQGSRAGQASFA